MRLLRDPLVHFVVAGVLVFALWGVAARRHKVSAPADGGATAARVITVGAGDVETLRAGFYATWKREPSPGELGDLVQGFVGEELLYREGMALGLDRGDRVVRRRVIEKMTALARPVTSPADPSREDLRRWFATYRHRFRRLATVTFEQLYFDVKHGDPAALAGKALTTLAAMAPTAPPPARFGDEIPLPENLVDRTDAEVIQIFGEEFATALATAPIGRWHGPVASKYGAHLVRVARREPERLPPFEEVERAVTADRFTVENRGQRAAAESLLPRYQITLAPEVRALVQDAPALAPFMQRVN
jgi:peptidyl-prolyl cis-trans isomerase C